VGVNLFETRPTELGAHADLIDLITAGEALGCVVRGAVGGDAIARALARLADVTPPQTPLTAGARTFGCMLAPTALAPTGPTLEAYLGAASWRAEALFDDGARGLDAMLSTLARGRPVVVPRSADGRAYARATVHVFPDGGEAPLHCDTYARVPARDELARAIDARTQVSWYLPLSLPEAGGELVLYDLRHGEPGAQNPAASGARATEHRIGVGDMVVFDGGRVFHRIARCHGSTPRRTFAGFAALSRNGEALTVWS
jgi:hypothetical protein